MVLLAHFIINFSSLIGVLGAIFFAVYESMRLISAPESMKILPNFPLILPLTIGLFAANSEFALVITVLEGLGLPVLPSI